MSVIAENRAEMVAPSALPATKELIEKRRKAVRRRARLTPAGSVQAKAVSGSEPTAPAPASPFTPISTTSASALNNLKKPWRKPKNVREFAAQANEIATMVLNNEIDLDTARNYASLARVVAQASSIEVTRARFLKQEPDLSLE